MNALDLAEYFDNADGSIADSEIAYTLRRQHEEILKLQGALGTISYVTEWGGDMESAQDDAEQALKDTEDLK